MVQLVAYGDAYKEETARRVVDFYGFHRALAGGGAPGAPTAEAIAGAEETIAEWTAPRHALYVITAGGAPAGFLHLGYRGDIAAWLEDVYVDPALRGQGIATAAIRQAEALVRATPGYTALCVDVVPRNTAALRLYHRLGYTGLSIVTLRKDFGPATRDRDLQLLGLEMKY